MYKCIQLCAEVAGHLMIVMFKKGSVSSYIFLHDFASIMAVVRSRHLVP